ncbi:MAG: bifunctional helix-turn-helix transcriptional regulator/GNAT family N-acetyltransferase [Ignavibacteriaceae bacterium]
MQEKDQIKELGEIALGSRLKRLSDRFMADAGKIYRMQHSDFEPRWFSFTHLLYNNGPMTVLDISSALKLSHPAVVQFINEMSKKNLISSEKDENDKRKRIVQLSDKGRQVFESIKPALSEIESSVKEIISATGYDILHVVESLEKELDKKNLYERTSEKLKDKLMKQVEITEFKKEYREYFKSLNIEWLKKYFTVEDEDERSLSSPEEEIINKGGMIFFAKYNGDIVGTGAAVKLDNKTFELSKMAVTEKAQGKQIGKKLALVVIGYAISHGAKSIVLETSRKLTAAVNLYERLGFIYAPLDKKSKYQRTNIMMRLEL